MKQITSKNNPDYKWLKSLAHSQRQSRLEGFALLEGIHLARAYYETYGLPHWCIVTEAALQNSEVQSLIKLLPPQKQYVVLKQLFSELSEVVHGTELLFLIKIPEVAIPEEQHEDCVILDGVQDAGNVGSILRSAAAAGIRHIYCKEGTALCWSPKVLRAGMGAHFMLNIIQPYDPEILHAALKVPVIGTGLTAQASLYDTNLRQPVAWVLGNEGAGVSAQWQSQANHWIKIPQPGQIESLNVAASAAVCFFEMVRQRLA